MTNQSPDLLTANRRALSFGFDRRGPHAGQPHPETGTACECEWSSKRWGDECPEHGETGVVIVAERREPTMTTPYTCQLTFPSSRRPDSSQIAHLFTEYFYGRYSWIGPPGSAYLVWTPSGVPATDDTRIEVHFPAGRGEPLTGIRVVAGPGSGWAAEEQGKWLKDSARGFAGKVVEEWGGEIEELSGE